MPISYSIITILDIPVFFFIILLCYTYRFIFFLFFSNLFSCSALCVDSLCVSSISASFKDRRNVVILSLDVQWMMINHHPPSFVTGWVRVNIYVGTISHWDE